MIFRAVREGKSYPEHGLSTKQWAQIPPRPVRLDQLITIKRNLALDRLLAEDSTFYGDLFPHVVQYKDDLYLEDGLHRALRAALQQRTSIHARVLILPAPAEQPPDPAQQGQPAGRGTQPGRRSDAPIRRRQPSPYPPSRG